MTGSMVDFMDVTCQRLCYGSRVDTSQFTDSVSGDMVLISVDGALGAGLRPTSQVKVWALARPPALGGQCTLSSCELWVTAGRGGCAAGEAKLLSRARGQSAHRDV